jgi:hypothetical protein
MRKLTLTGVAVRRIPAISSDTFSARWIGQVLAPQSQTYTFHVRADDGVRLWVDGKLLVDQWKDQGVTEYSGTIALAAGKRYDITMEYYEMAADAVVQLSWSSSSTAKQVIPQSQLYGVQPPTPTPLPIPTPVPQPTPVPTPVPAPTPVPVIVAAPTFQVDGGVYDAAQDVIVACETPGAVIRYTTNGNDPTESDPVVVSGRTVRVANSLTLKAKAWGRALTSAATTAQTVFVTSPIKAANYTINTRPADTTAPTINVLAPLQNQTYTGLAAANGTAADTGGSGLNAVYGRLMRYVDGYYWNGSTWTSQAVDLPCSDSASAWTCPLPYLVDGRYSFIAKAQDRAGNTANSPLINFTIAATPVVTPTPVPTPTPLPPVLTPPSTDVVAPTVTVRTPVHEATYKWLKTASGKARDIGGSRVQAVYGRLMRYSDNYYWNGTGWTPQAANLLCKGKTAWKLALPELADGRYAFMAVAQDGAGNLGMSPAVNFFIAAPTSPVGKNSVPSAFPAGNASVAQQTISLSFVQSLDMSAIADRTNFLVDVNGIGVPLSNIAFAGSSNAVVLQLNANTFKSEDRVRVLWQDLMNSQGQPIPDGAWAGSPGGS